MTKKVWLYLVLLSSFQNAYGLNWDCTYPFSYPESEYKKDLEKIDEILQYSSFNRYQVGADSIVNDLVETFGDNELTKELRTRKENLSDYQKNI